MEDIKVEASKLYSKKLPYHNFNHALEVIEIGKKICKRCKKEGVAIDEKVVEMALLFHDAGYHKDSLKLGFDSKEEYSSFLAQETLRKFNFSSQFIKAVKKSIIGTHRDKEFKTNEEKAVRASDLAGLSGSYDKFLANNLNLKKEAEILSRKKISGEAWQESTKKIIEFYIKQDIYLTKASKNKNGESVFHLKAQKNLKKFLKSS